MMPAVASFFSERCSEYGQHGVSTGSGSDRVAAQEALKSRG